MQHKFTFHAAIKDGETVVGPIKVAEGEGLVAWLSAIMLEASLQTNEVSRRVFSSSKLYSGHE